MLATSAPSQLGEFGVDAGARFLGSHGVGLERGRAVRVLAEAQPHPW